MYPNKELSFLQISESKSRKHFFNLGKRQAWGPAGECVLVPMLFNIFINDIFFHVTRAKLNAYGDDHQMY